MQTYKVFLALLYENKRYAELFELYKEIRKHLELYELFPDHTINCLVFAACYHLVNFHQFNIQNFPFCSNEIQISEDQKNFIYFSKFLEYARAFSVCTGFISTYKASETDKSFKIPIGWISIKTE